MELGATTMNQRILLVDDDEQFALGLQQACADEKVDLILAKSALQGIDIAWDHSPSAIVLSVEVSNNQGYKLCHAIKRNAKREFDRHSKLKGRAESYCSKLEPTKNLVSSILGLPKMTSTQYFPAVPGIPVEKPVLISARSTMAFWVIFACIVLTAVLWLTSLR